MVVLCKHRSGGASALGPCRWPPGQARERPEALSTGIHTMPHSRPGLSGRTILPHVAEIQDRTRVGLGGRTIPPSARPAR